MTNLMRGLAVPIELAQHCGLQCYKHHTGHADMLPQTTSVLSPSLGASSLLNSEVSEVRKQTSESRSAKAISLIGIPPPKRNSTSLQHSLAKPHDVRSRGSRCLRCSRRHHFSVPRLLVAVSILEAEEERADAKEERAETKFEE